MKRLRSLRDRKIYTLYNEKTISFPLRERDELYVKAADPTGLTEEAGRWSSHFCFYERMRIIGEFVQASR